MRDTIALEYEGLPDGATAAGELCPSCKGGSTGEGTFSVTREGSFLKFYCHRASCGLKGSTGSSAHHVPRTVVPPVRGIVGRNYIATSGALPEDVRQRLIHDYCINKGLASRWGIGWNEEEKRVVLPVYNLQGEADGSVLRSLSGAKPKTISHTDPMVMAWYANVNSRKCLIVEDQLSAIRGSEYMNAVALLGTNLNEDRAYEIKAKGFTEIYLALDADAYPLSVRLAALYKNVLPIRLLRLGKDIKNHNRDELQHLLGPLTT